MLTNINPTTRRPTQAVILAGGRGIRLGHLTDALPKPMLAFNNRPFLEYLIEMLQGQGFKQIILLLGYLPDPIQSHFGDGSKWGVEIKYSITDVKNNTGRRLKLITPQLDNIFLMTYCDNYWPLQMDQLWMEFNNNPTKAMITVYDNSDGYTKSNLTTDKYGYVTKYDKTRSAQGLEGVDLGFALLNRSVIERLPNDNISFEEFMYPRLVRERQLRAYVTQHRYYSIGSPERLAVTSEFLSGQPTVLLDRDGVLNRKMARATYVTSISDWEWLPGAQEALMTLHRKGYRTIVVSNQPGVSRKAMTQSDLDDITRHMNKEALASGGNINATYYCTHGWDDGCWCRKPNPGLLFQAQRDFHLDLTKTVFFGDDVRDQQAALAAGCQWANISEDRPLLSAIKELIDSNRIAFEKL